MASLWKNPYNHYKPWSRCSTCGQPWPSQKVSYNPRLGWQCPPCWDGLLQHDQYETPIFPYEGTRKVNSPIVNSLTEGIAPGSLFQTYIYNFRDRYTGDIYLVHMAPLTISGNGTLAWVNTPGSLTLGIDPLEPIFDAMRWTNSYNIFVGNGQILTEVWNPLSPNVLNVVQGICDFGPVSTAPMQFLLYDRSHKENIYQVIFHDNSDPVFPGQIEVVRAIGPAVGGILLNDNWSFFINEDQANYDQNPYSPEIMWDNSHQFFVDTSSGVPELIYIP